MLYCQHHNVKGYLAGCCPQCYYELNTKANEHVMKGEPEMPIPLSDIGTLSQTETHIKDAIVVYAQFLVDRWGCDRAGPTDALVALVVALRAVRNTS